MTQQVQQKVTSTIVPIPQNPETKQQVLAVMLLFGTGNQRLEALAYITNQRASVQGTEQQQAID
jgi:hypothetical protein